MFNAFAQSFVSRTSTWTGINSFSRCQGCQEFISIVRRFTFCRRCRLTFIAASALDSTYEQFLSHPDSDSSDSSLAQFISHLFGRPHVSAPRLHSTGHCNTQCCVSTATHNPHVFFPVAPHHSHPLSCLQRSWWPLLFKPLSKVALPCCAACLTCALPLSRASCWRIWFPTLSLAVCDLALPDRPGNDGFPMHCGRHSHNVLCSVRSLHPLMHGPFGGTIPTSSLCLVYAQRHLIAWHFMSAIASHPPTRQSARFLA